MRDTRRKILSKDKLVQIATEFFEATGADKKEVLKKYNISRPTLWRRLSEAGIKIDVKKQVSVV